MAIGAWSRLKQRFGVQPAPAAVAGDLLDAARSAIRAGDSERALDLLLRVTSLSAENPYAWALLGWARNDLGQVDEARMALDRALALDPGNLEALNTMGVIASDLPEPAVAIGYFESALRQDPENVVTRYNLAQRLFFAGDYRRAFALLRARHLAHHSRENPLAPMPIWQGEVLEGKHVFVWCDWGGLGDHLQFARYVPLLRERVRPARLTLGCQQECQRLFAGIEGVDAVVPPGTVPLADVHAPLLDLPFWFDTGPDNVPARIPYLNADVALAHTWRERLVADSRGAAGYLVGLVWATGKWNQGVGYDRVRAAKSVPAAMLAPLGAAGTLLVSLQKDADTLPPVPLIDLTANIADFADTAALISCVDMVVSGDTAVAHLAGAMGKPVLLMLRHEGGMFWSLDARQSPWYPSMTILRQKKSGAWQEVVNDAARIIATKLVARASAT